MKNWWKYKVIVQLSGCQQQLYCLNTIVLLYFIENKSLFVLGSAKRNEGDQ